MLPVWFTAILILLKEYVYKYILHVKMFQLLLKDCRRVIIINMHLCMYVFFKAYGYTAHNSMNMIEPLYFFLFQLRGLDHLIYLFKRV